MASVKIILDKRKATSNGSYPIYFQICHKRKTTTRSTKIYIQATDWDDTSKSILKSNSLYKILNLKLQKQYAELQTQLLLADDKSVQGFLYPEAEEVRVIIVKKTVLQFAQDLIDQLKNDEKTGNAWVYQSTLKALKDFHRVDNLYFENIDYQFLTRYNSFLLKRDLTHNPIYLYIRTIRIFYNKAIKLKIVDRTHYPFDDYKLRPEKTKKRAVDLEIIKAIRMVDLVIDTPIWHSRNYFMLSFYLIGISIVDLTLLKQENIQNDRVIYKRRKTGKWYDIKLQSQALQLLDLYKGDTHYLLPIANLKANNDEQLIRGIKSKTKLINKHLSKIVEGLKMDLKVTTYTARHSWATLAKKSGFSIELIAEALGHEYGNRITAVYLDNFEQSVIDDMNARVINLVSN